MSEKVDTPEKPAQPGELSGELDNPPLWSPWNFQTRRRDWHEVIYDEMLPTYVKNENT